MQSDFSVSIPRKSANACDLKIRHRRLGIAGSVSGYDSSSGCTKFLGSSFGYSDLGTFSTPPPHSPPLSQ